MHCRLTLGATSRITLAKVDNICVDPICPTFSPVSLPKLDGVVVIGESILTKRKVC